MKNSDAPYPTLPSGSHPATSQTRKSTIGAVLEIFSAFGLSSSAGLNAYLPLFIAGLMGRFTNLFTLGEPWNTLENGWVLLMIGILLLVEFTVDKIPVVDSINDTVQTIIRPVAGALLFAASTNAINDLHPAFGMILGLLLSLIHI